MPKKTDDATQITDDDKGANLGGEGQDVQGLGVPDKEPPKTDEDQIVLDKDSKQRLDSALGRISGIQGKVNGFESQLTDLTEKMGEIHNIVSGRGNLNFDLEPKDDVTPEEMPTTKKELDEYFDRRTALQKQKDQNYSDTYIKTVEKLSKGEENPEIHKAIVDEMMANFNFRYSDDATLDAESNYNKAARAYYKKQVSLQDKTSPLTGPGDGTPPLGGGLGGEEMVGKEVPMPKLDDAASDYVRRTGMSEEKVKAALTGEMPTGLRPNEKF